MKKIILIVILCIGLALSALDDGSCEGTRCEYPEKIVYNEKSQVLTWADIVGVPQKLANRWLAVTQASSINTTENVINEKTKKRIALYDPDLFDLIVKMSTVFEKLCDDPIFDFIPDPERLCEQLKQSNGQKFCRSDSLDCDEQMMKHMDRFDTYVLVSNGFEVDKSIKNWKQSPVSKLIGQCVLRHKKHGNDKSFVSDASRIIHVGQDDYIIIRTFPLKNIIVLEPEWNDDGWIKAPDYLCDSSY